MSINLALLVGFCIGCAAMLLVVFLILLVVAALLEEEHPTDLTDRTEPTK